MTLFPVTPTEIKLHKRTVCQMKGNFMYFVTYFMQSTRKTNIMSSRTQNMRLKFIASPFIIFTSPTLFLEDNLENDQKK